MKFNTIRNIAIAMMMSVVAFNCSKNETNESLEADLTTARNNSVAGTYVQEDQMARPAINTVFNSTADSKNTYNVTIPSEQGAFQPAFEARLLALNPGYTTNVLGLDATTFTTVLATDVLNISLDGATSFGTLTGRGLADDVIDVELLLIFGGPDGTDLPQLTSDNVDGNDKDFLSSFPYAASPW